MQNPTYDASALTGYGANPLDRLANHRDDPAFVARLREAQTVRHVVFTGDIPLLRQRGAALDPFFGARDLAALGSARETVLLGQDDAGAIFATLLEEAAPESGEGDTGLVSLDLRSLAVQGLLPAPLLGVMAQAKSILHWHARHRFCAQCGAATQASSGGWKRLCAACSAQHFPRTDPVVIMLVTDGDTCLVGRQPRFNPGMYSALAGFIEPGETVEAAVRREVAEEAGVRVGAVAYHASQPWPFPASLMIGCFAQALSREIVVDTTELEDARWISRTEVQAMFAGAHPGGLIAPAPIAIAHHLMRAFAEAREPGF
ncbi:MAG: diphosphatase [Hyphomicrobiales bacterium]|nr:diphosphatase [Hyphomicrobiales bacterium]